MASQESPVFECPITPQKSISDLSRQSLITFGGGRLPPTPDHTPDRERKRSFSSVSDDFLSCASPTKRRSATIKTVASRRTIRPGLVPPFSIMHQASRQKGQRLAADELKRVCESVLGQIDWEEVVEYTASNRRPGVYRSAIKGILQKQVSKQFGREEQCDSSE